MIENLRSYLEIGMCEMEISTGLCGDFVILCADLGGYAGLLPFYASIPEGYAAFSRFYAWIPEAYADTVYKFVIILFRECYRGNAILFSAIGWLACIGMFEVFN